MDKKLDEAISTLANLFEYGHLQASVNPAELINKVADEIKRLRRAVSPGASVVRCDDECRLPDDEHRLADDYAEEMHKTYKPQTDDVATAKIYARLDFMIVFIWLKRKGY